MAVTTITVKIADLESFAIFLERVKTVADHSPDAGSRKILAEAITEFFNGSPD